MTVDEIADFAYNNKTAILLRMIALDDYIACRLCMLNGLIPQGFIMAEQAIEKELKSILLIYNPNFDLSKHRRHLLEPLIQKIQEIEDLGLSTFQSFCKRISDLYELERYPDNKLLENIKSWGASTIELHEIDELFFHINDVSPIHHDVKFHSGLYMKLFSKSQISHKDHNWLVANNKAFLNQQKELKQEYERI